MAALCSALCSALCALCALILFACLGVAVLSGCTKTSQIDYLVLVNRGTPLPEGWEEALDVVTLTNSVGDTVEVEAAAYKAYVALEEALEAEGVFTQLDSARRSIAEQQATWDEFMVKYGEEYTRSHVAVPGYSEHHTGLALDLYLIVDGVTAYENEDLMRYPEVWAVIHAKLADYGFILRYLEGAEDITGYDYEPWHIRYVGSAKVAHEIMDAGITLEEYLGVAGAGGDALPEAA